MKVLIICSKHFYNKIPDIKTAIEKTGHLVILPNSYDAPFKEYEMKALGAEEHRIWKSGMLREEKVSDSDAVLVLNLEKNGERNYIGRFFSTTPFRKVFLRTN